jgi:excisionase family DNA binding protein
VARLGSAVAVSTRERAANENMPGAATLAAEEPANDRPADDGVELFKRIAYAVAVGCTHAFEQVVSGRGELAARNDRPGDLHSEHTVRNAEHDARNGEPAARNGEPAARSGERVETRDGAGDVMNADAVAVYLGVDRNTVYEYAARGVIPHQRLGKRMLFHRAALVSWLSPPCKAASIRKG